MKCSEHGDDAYQDEYWQSERYFYDIPEQIRDVFTLKKTSKNALEMEKGLILYKA